MDQKAHSPKLKRGLKRVLSGMRPTGKLHLGNYMGALYNWVRLQRDFNCYFFIADWHALTTDYADTSNLKQNIMEVALDWLAAGLDPERCVLFVQSLAPQHAELHLLLSMITPLGWLERQGGIPLGWRFKPEPGQSPKDFGRDWRRAPNTGLGWLLKIAGILFTGFAVSLGAPFWFDVLNKVMVIRSTVKPDEKSPDEASKS